MSMKVTKRYLCKRDNHCAHKYCNNPECHFTLIKKHARKFGGRYYVVDISKKVKKARFS